MDIESQIEIKKQKLLTLLNSEFRALNGKYKDLNFSGIYAIYEDGKLIYVGESRNVGKRIKQISTEGHTLNKYFLSNPNIESDRDIERHLRRKCKFKVLETTNRMMIEYFIIGVLEPKANGKRLRKLR